MRSYRHTVTEKSGSNANRFVQQKTLMCFCNCEQSRHLLSSATVCSLITQILTVTGSGQIPLLISNGSRFRSHKVSLWIKTGPGKCFKSRQVLDPEEMLVLSSTLFCCWKFSCSGNRKSSWCFLGEETLSLRTGIRRFRCSFRFGTQKLEIKKWVGEMNHYWTVNVHCASVATVWQECFVSWFGKALHSEACRKCRFTKQ